MLDVKHEISAVIFDLGGVILDLDIPRYRRLMAEAIGRPDIGDPFTAKPPQFFYDLERGQISPDEFLAAAEAHAEEQGSFDAQKFIHAFNSIVGGVTEARLEFLDSLKGRFKLCVLSNTNALHTKAFEPMFEQLRPGRPIGSYFDQVFYSHEVGHRKPEREAYEAVLRQAKLRPESTLFIDDLAENIASAEALGIRGHHLTGELLADEELMALLSVRPSG